jgi:hypothetical protein
LPGHNFAAGLIELGLHLIFQFKLVLEVIVNPGLDLLDFAKRQLWNSRLNFLNGAHRKNLVDNRRLESPIAIRQLRLSLARHIPIIPGAVRLHGAEGSDCLLDFLKSSLLIGPSIAVCSRVSIFVPL